MNWVTCVIANTTKRSKKSSKRGDPLFALGRLSVHPYELLERGTSLIVTPWA
jgi:hypothetical protein